MTKQAYREAKRVQPIGLAGIEQCRVIAKQGYAKVNEVMVDAFSASAIYKVFDKLNFENQQKFAALPVGKAADVAFRLIGGA